MGIGANQLSVAETYTVLRTTIKTLNNLSATYARRLGDGVVNFNILTAEIIPTFKNLLEQLPSADVFDTQWRQLLDDYASTQLLSAPDDFVADYEAVRVATANVISVAVEALPVSAGGKVAVMMIDSSGNVTVEALQETTSIIATLNALQVESD